MNFLYIPFKWLHIVLHSKTCIHYEKVIDHKQLHNWKIRRRIAAMQILQFNQTIDSQTKAQGGNLPSGFCLVDISLRSTLFSLGTLTVLILF